MNVSIRHGSMLDAKDSILSMIAKLAYVLAFGMIIRDLERVSTGVDHVDVRRSAASGVICSSLQIRRIVSSWEHHSLLLQKPSWDLITILDVT